jgi:predicted alpha/beta-hydrolase family hydrolase
VFLMLPGLSPLPVFCYTYVMNTLPRIRWPWLLLILVVVVAVGFVVWALSGPGAQPVSLAALESDARVVVDRDRWLAFAPTGAQPTAGLILYPGGRVDARAYAPLAREIASAGFRVVIVPMPFRLAVLAPDRATSVMAAYPEISHWAVGGHSLGGAMAARYAQRHPGDVDGLVLWAAYPAASNDLSESALAVTSIYGTRDGLATEDKINASRVLLPLNTIFVPIEGGNHAGFGEYGPQSGDLPATISAQEQQRQIVAATVILLQALASLSD